MSSCTVLSAVSHNGDIMAFSKLVSRLKKAFGFKCAHKKQPREPLKPTGSPTENRPMTDDLHVVAGKQNFLACSSRRATVHDQFPALEIHELQDEPISSSKFFHTAVNNLELEVVQPSVLDAPADKDCDSTEKSEVNSFDSAVVIENISAEVHFTADTESAESSLRPDFPELDFDSPPSSPEFDTPISSAAIDSPVSSAALVIPASSSSDEDTEPPVREQFSTDGLIQKVSQDDYAVIELDSTVNSTGAIDTDSAVNPTADDGTCLDNNDISCRYKLGKQLGEGGFGSVFEGIRIQDGLQVAVKFVQKTPDSQNLCSSRDQPPPLEITLASMASSGSRCRNIIQLLDWQVFKNHYVMVMERPTPSMDLEAFLQLSGGALSEQTAQNIMRQAVYAANVCCYRGVFHRDIKLQNLLINPNTLEVKLIDFGCGDYMMDSAYSNFSGTEAYIPPEFYERGYYQAIPATVYSLGVLLFTMLHGDFPSAYDLYYLEHDWSKFTLSQECCNLMLACLHQNPERRIPLEQMPYHDWFMLDTLPECQ